MLNISPDLSRYFRNFLIGGSHRDILPLT